MQEVANLLHFQFLDKEKNIKKVGDKGLEPLTYCV